VCHGTFVVGLGLRRTDCIVAVRDVDCERWHAFESWSSQAALQACSWWESRGDRRGGTGLTARALALPPLEQRDFRLQKLLKHDAIPVKSGIGNTDIQAWCSPYTVEGFIFSVVSWIEEVLCMLRACSDWE
jgi:hypothetical protein